MRYHLEGAAGGTTWCGANDTIRQVTSKLQCRHRELSFNTTRLQTSDLQIVRFYCLNGLMEISEVRSLNAEVWRPPLTIFPGKEVRFLILVLSIGTTSWQGNVKELK